MTGYTQCATCTPTHTHTYALGAGHCLGQIDQHAEIKYNVQLKAPMIQIYVANDDTAEQFL